MKIAYDPWMIRERTLDDVCRFAAEIGYEWIELSPRDDVLPLFLGARTDSQRLSGLKQSMRNHRVGLASMWSVYRWAEPDDREKCRSAVGYFKRFIETAVELGCSHISSEFGGRPGEVERSEAAFRNSIDQVLPILEREQITLALDPHPGDWVEDGYAAMNVIRSLQSPWVKFLYSAAHTFYMDQRRDMASLLTEVLPETTLVRCADTFDHRIPVRYIVNPIGAPVVVHQHLNIGEGEIDWGVFFATLKSMKFDGVLSNSVFAWPDRADQSARRMLQAMRDGIKAPTVA